MYENKVMLLTQKCESILRPYIAEKLSTITNATATLMLETGGNNKDDVLGYKDYSLKNNCNSSSKV